MSVMALLRLVKFNAVGIMLRREECILLKKAESYAIRVVKMYQYLVNVKHETTLSRQVLRSGTSIGANVAESRRAQSTADFVSKLSIALKEAEETGYWLKTLCGGGYLSEEEFSSMNADNEELIRIMVSSIKTVKRKMGRL